MIHTPVYIMSSLILPVISVTYQRYHHVIMHEVAILDKLQRFPHCQVVVPHVASLPNIGPDQSVMLPEVGCKFTRQRHFKKTVTKCTVTKDVETSRLSSNTRQHYITPLVSKA